MTDFCDSTKASGIFNVVQLQTAFSFSFVSVDVDITSVLWLCNAKPLNIQYSIVFFKVLYNILSEQKMTN